MKTVIISHPIFQQHLVPDHHPEHPGRIEAIEQALAAPAFAELLRHQPGKASPEVVALAHSPSLLSMLETYQAQNDGGLVWVDEETSLSPHSLEAALCAVGGACEAVDMLFSGVATNAFAVLRPPGHHATRQQSMGFCLLNNVAIAARYAQQKHGIARVAIVDFDVHHGNGTQDIFAEDASVLYASTHQQPLFPGTGDASETGVGNLYNCPLPANSGGEAFRMAYTETILPAIDKFAPQLILVSAGFDGHRLDPLAGLNLEVADYLWLTQELKSLAEMHCGGRMAYLLEGGYHVAALADCVQEVVRELQT